MAVYLIIMAALILAIFFVSLWAHRLSKGNKEARRIMDRFYIFVAIASVGVKNGHLSGGEQQTLTLEIREAVVGGSMLERLRRLDAVMDRFDGMLDKGTYNCEAWLQKDRV